MMELGLVHLMLQRAYSNHLILYCERKEAGLYKTESLPLELYEGGQAFRLS